MTTGHRIVFGEDDFKDATPIAPLTAPPAGVALPPVSRSSPLQVGTTQSGFAVAAPKSSGLLNAPITAALVPAIVGMLIAWGVTEVTNLVNLPDHANSRASLNAYSGI